MNDHPNTLPETAEATDLPPAAEETAEAASEMEAAEETAAIDEAEAVEDTAASEKAETDAGTETEEAAAETEPEAESETNAEVDEETTADDESEEPEPCAALVPAETALAPVAAAPDVLLPAAPRPPMKKGLIIGLAAAGVAVAAFLILLFTYLLPAQNYKAALAAASEAHYDEAVALFKKHPDFKDSGYQIKLNRAKSLLEQSSYEEAYALLNSIGETEMVSNSKYLRAKALYEDSEYTDAIALFEEIKDYKDAAELIKKCETAQKAEFLSTAKGLLSGLTTAGSLLEDIGNEIKMSWLAYAFNKYYHGSRYYSPDSAISAALSYMSSDVSTSKGYRLILSQNRDALSDADTFGDSLLAAVRTKVDAAYRAYLDMYECVLEPSGNLLSWAKEFGNTDSVFADALRTLMAAIKAASDATSETPSAAPDTPAVAADTAVSTAPAPAAADAAAEKRTVPGLADLFVVATKQDALRVRKEPNTDAEILASLPKGTKVIRRTPYDDKAADGWTYISFDSYKYGWVKTEFIAPALTGDLTEASAADRLALFYTLMAWTKANRAAPPPHADEMMDAFVGKGKWIYAGFYQSDGSPISDYIYIDFDFGDSKYDWNYCYDVRGETITKIPAVDGSSGYYPSWAYGKTFDEWGQLGADAVAKADPAYANAEFGLTLGEGDVFYLTPQDNSCTFEVNYRTLAVQKTELQQFGG